MCVIRPEAVSLSMWCNKLLENLSDHILLMITIFITIFHTKELSKDFTCKYLMNKDNDE